MRYLILILLFSCAQNQKQYDLTNVDMDTNGPVNVEIDKTQSSGYGQDNGKLTDVEAKPRSAVVGLTLYSSMYQSLAVLELIKKLEKSEINISIISSQGFGSVLAALYAKEKSASYLEWKFFDLLKRLKDTQVYSSIWKKIIEDFIEREFKELEVSQLKVLLLIPEFIDGSIRLNKTEKVTTVLKRALSFKDTKNYLLHPELYSDQLLDHGADISLMVSFLPEFISFKKLDGFEWGIYTRYLGKVLNKNSQITIFRTSNKIELDSQAPLSDINQLYSEKLETYVLEIVSKHKQWQEENTSSTIN